MTTKPRKGGGELYYVDEIAALGIKQKLDGLRWIVPGIFQQPVYQRISFAHVRHGRCPFVSVFGRSLTWWVLLFCAKHLFVAAIGGALARTSTSGWCSIATPGWSATPGARGDKAGRAIMPGPTR